MLGAAVLVCAPAALASGDRLPVLGFQPESDSPLAIARNAAGLSAVGVDGVSMTGPGKVTAVDSAQLLQRDTASAYHLSSALLVSNYSNRTRGFSEKLAYETLRSPRAVWRLVANLKADVENDGWNGVILDLESLQTRDIGGLVGLATELRRALPRTLTVGLTLTNFTSAAGYASGGYGLPGLAASGCDLVLMAYDQHGPWEKQPGPIGALNWTREGLEVLLHYASPSKIVLGVSGYGYGWERHRNVVLTDAQAEAMARRRGARERWIPAVGEWTARLRNGTVIWWSGARSLKVRERLAATMHLGGLAVWSLGSTDTITR